MMIRSRLWKLRSVADAAEIGDPVIDSFVILNEMGLGDTSLCTNWSLYVCKSQFVYFFGNAHN